MLLAEGFVRRAFVLQAQISLACRSSNQRVQVVLEQTASHEKRNESLSISDGKVAKTASRKFDRKSCNVKRRMHPSKWKGMKNSVFRKEVRVRGMVVVIEEYMHAGNDGACERNRKHYIFKGSVPGISTRISGRIYSGCKAAAKRERFP